MSYQDTVSRERTLIGTMIWRSTGLQGRRCWCQKARYAWGQRSIRREIMDNLKTSPTKEPAA
jgi:hypothetical protein